MTNKFQKKISNRMDDNSKKERIYDLEERTYVFGRDVRLRLRKLKIDSYNESDIKQAVRSSGSVGANYIEANEALSKKDFSHRVKICRKEAMETAYWIRMIMETHENGIGVDLKRLFGEAIELKKIFSSIIEKGEK